MNNTSVLLTDGGIEGATEVRVGSATPEKARFDTAYLLAGRSGRGVLAEVELPDGFDVDAPSGWVERIASARGRTLTVRALGALDRSVRCCLTH